MQRQRVSADYLQTSAVIDADGSVHSAVNDPNAYAGPGHGLSPRGRALGAAAAAAIRARPGRSGLVATEPCRQFWQHSEATRRRGAGRRRRRRRPGVRRRCSARRSTACRMRTFCARSRTASARAARRRGSSASAASRTSPSSATTARSSPARGSRSASSRRARRSSIAPTCSRSTTSSSSGCRRSTRSTPTARWAGTPPRTRSGEAVGPVPTELDNFARAKLIVRTTLLHARETRGCRPGRRAGRAGARVKIYFAGPLFTPAERRFIDECAVQLRAAASTSSSRTSTSSPSTARSPRSGSSRRTGRRSPRRTPCSRSSTAR